MKYENAILGSPLFSGMAAQEAQSMLGCLGAKQKSYEKHQFILRAGDEARAVGMVLHGSVQIVREDFWGNRNLLAKAWAGELFAEAYACTPGAALGASVLAEERTTALFLDVSRILTVCSSACAYHARLIQNLLGVLAQKNLLLNRKLAHITQRTTREKLLSYLSAEAMAQGDSSFLIPYNRQQLADYLSVDRSAMSAELGRMRDEGLLRFERNRFTLLG